MPRGLPAAQALFGVHSVQQCILHAISPGASGTLRRLPPVLPNAPSTLNFQHQYTRSINGPFCASKWRSKIHAHAVKIRSDMGPSASQVRFSLENIQIISRTAQFGMFCQGAGDKHNMLLGSFSLLGPQQGKCAFALSCCPKICLVKVSLELFSRLEEGFEFGEDPLEWPREELWTIWRGN